MPEFLTRLFEGTQIFANIGERRCKHQSQLKIDGVLLTMVDSSSKETAALLRNTYGPKIKVFDTEILRSVRAAEISTEGKSIFEHDPGGKVAAAYHALTKEVLCLEEQQPKHMQIRFLTNSKDKSFTILGFESETERAAFFDCLQKKRRLSR